MDLQIRFCTASDGTRIAYAMYGGGPGLPLVFSSSWASNLELVHQSSQQAFNEELALDRPVVIYDRRGSGASQRDIGEGGYLQKTHVEDLASLVDHLELDRFHLFGLTESTFLCTAYAAEQPERVSRLIFWGPFARSSDRASPEMIATTVQLIRGNWGMARRAMGDLGFPTGPVEMQRFVARYYQESIAPEVAARFLKAEIDLDITGLLPHVAAPTLVLHRRGDRNVPISAGRAVAAFLPDARFVALEGDIAFLGYDPDEYVGLIREFLVEAEPRNQPPEPSGTAIILFADIANSTSLTEEMGDAAFREKARALDAALREAIESNSGTAIEGKLLGDGVLATFGAAREAIACAQEMHRLSGGAKGPSDQPPATSDLLLHVGIHAGDVIREDAPDGRANVFGGAVNIAARISDASEAGETLVSGTVRDLARTSAGVSFEDRGERDLKGVADAVRVWAVQA